jgi:hypothetical protein
MEMGEKIAWGSDTSLMREAADRIEELEGGLHKMALEYLDAASKSYQAQLKAEAKLAKALEALTDIVKDCEAEYPPSHGAIKYFCRTTLAEMKGEDRR